MAWLVVDEDGQEVESASYPRWNKEEGAWIAADGKIAEIPKGTIQKLTGRCLTWLDEPIEI